MKAHFTVEQNFLGRWALRLGEITVFIDQWGKVRSAHYPDGAPKHDRLSAGCVSGNMPEIRADYRAKTGKSRFGGAHSTERRDFLQYAAEYLNSKFRRNFE